MLRSCFAVTLQKCWTFFKPLNKHFFFFTFFLLFFFFPPVAGERYLPPRRAVHHRERPADSDPEGQEGRTQNSLPATDRQTVRQHVINEMNLHHRLLVLFFKFFLPSPDESAQQPLWTPITDKNTWALLCVLAADGEILLKSSSCREVINTVQSDVSWTDCRATNLSESSSYQKRREALTTAGASGLFQ